MLDPIVVPLDGSAASAQAIPFATRLCSRTGAKLLLVRGVVTASPAVVTNASAARIMAAHLAVAVGEEDRAAVVERLRSGGLEVSSQVQIGNPAAVVLAEAHAGGRA